MKCLGKIFLVLLLLEFALMADVKAQLDRTSIVQGQRVTYTLKISGEDIQKPQISTLCGSDVIATASQTNIEMINGNYKKTYALLYTFMPEKSCMVKPIDVYIGSKKYTTQALHVEVKLAKNISDANFMLALSSDKKEVYVGEPFSVTLVFKQKNTAAVVDNKFVAPKFQGFWIKEEGTPQVSRGSDYVTTTLVYKLAAQREGVLGVAPAQMAIATRSSRRDMWGSYVSQIQWKSYFSNELQIKAKALPNNASLIGDFTISTKLSKVKVNQNEPLNISIEVLGEGNLEDIQNFKPYIQGVSVFDEKAKIKGNKLSQKIALVADANFTIPSFSISFFNTKTKRVEKISTKSIDIEVIGSVPKVALEVKREKPALAKTPQVITQVQVQELPISKIVLIFVLGVIAGVGLMLLQKFVQTKKKKGFHYKDEKQLFMKLLPYKDDAEVQTVLDMLELNLYTANKQSIDKKLLQNILKKYEIN